MAGRNENFGFDPEDFDRFAREAADGLRQVLGRFVSEPAASSRRTKPEPTTAGEVGAGVWAVFDVDDRGDARVEQVFATEIDALRANQHNTDPRRRVRFLPYGIAVSALGGSAIAAGDGGSEDENRGDAAGESAQS
ncbi:hypothetical protein EF294_10195 [Gordonia oryzae]|uniref:Uncharacterized protein n=1 Tax=Gordonia oryzae TaxID=2487349 RepID=A0A3N4GTE0_9ACTN|nr:hypothetical protein [Gordonia oryzae]RPA62351.1 hypothetical protein EF294_10195 [Gordonia oryzae]